MSKLIRQTSMAAPDFAENPMTVLRTHRSTFLSAPVKVSRALAGDLIRA